MKKRTLVIISILGVLIIGVPTTAIIWYHQFLQKHVLMPPDTPEIFESIKLGEEYSSQGKFKEAEEIFKKAIESDPDCALSYNLLGECYYKQKRYDEATEMFNKVLEINPRHRGTQFSLSTIKLMEDTNILIEHTDLMFKKLEEGLSPEEKERYDYLTKQLEERREGKSFKERLKESGITEEDLIKEAMKDGMTREEAEELFLK